MLGMPPLPRGPMPPGARRQQQQQQQQQPYDPYMYSNQQAEQPRVVMMYPHQPSKNQVAAAAEVVAAGVDVDDDDVDMELDVSPDGDGGGSGDGGGGGGGREEKGASGSSNKVSLTPTQKALYKEIWRVVAVELKRHKGKIEGGREEVDKLRKKLAYKLLLKEVGKGHTEMLPDTPRKIEKYVQAFMKENGKGKGKGKGK